jgi:WD40 repeat protein/serine/threonine protein kinase
MNERSIFAAALDIADPVERAAYLDNACGQQPALRKQLDELLAAQEKLGSFLTRPPSVLEKTAAYEPIREGAGSTIGPYKLLQQIGEGGMGIVYMAEQQEPVRRKVALKIIKPGMDSAQVIARFEAERQALAMMDHQNIAKVFDAGTTDTGRPYFMMELVHGVPLTAFCDENRLTLRERLELFVPVCHAIQHAHQKGIIHRDVKPSNVLVTMYDDRPVPKVIDFGIAKATDQRLTERTMFTQFGTMVGTFEYMSPEQAEMNAFGVDTRSDIYSLGVLLYELLTGSTPLEKARVRAAAFNEVVRIIKEEEPPRPSIRLSKSGTAASIAAARKTEPHQLSKLVRGDLDWIVMRCLEKQRDRRYETANGLARDIQRYLSDEPVEARPPSAGYRMQKFIRRNNGRVVAAGLLLLLLLLGIAGTTWGMLAAQKAQHAAEEQRIVAVNERNQKERARKQADEERKRADAEAKSAMAEKNIALQQEAVATAEKQRAESERRRADAKAAEALTQKDRANQNAATALAEKQRAEKELLRSEELLYANEIASAQHEWDTSDVVSAWRSLRSCRRDLRGWEYNFLYTLCSRNLERTIDLVPEATNAGHTADGIVLSTGNVTCAALSPDGKRIVSGSIGDTLTVWDMTSGRREVTLNAREVVGCLAFSPDGQRIVTGCWGRTLKVWDVGKHQERLVDLFDLNYRLLLTLEGNSITAVTLAFSSDGKRIAAVCDENTFRIWDAASGRAITTVKGPPAKESCAALSPDWKQFASASANNTLVIWDATNGRTIHTLSGHTAGVNCAAFSPDGKRIASGSDDSTLKVWDQTTGKELHTLRSHRGSVNCVAFSPDGTHVISGSNEGELTIWDAVTGEKTVTLTGHTGPIVSVAFRPDGKQVVSASFDGTLKIWDATNQPETSTLQGHAAAVNCVACSPDGKRIVSGSWDKTLKVWDASTGMELHTLKGHSGIVTSVAFSHNGKRIVSGSMDHTLKIWDAASGKETRTTDLHTDDAMSVTFSPDGKWIGGGVGRTVKLWDSATGREIQSLSGHDSTIVSVAFSRDGRRIVSGSRDATLKVWDATSGRRLLTINGIDRQIGPIASVAFSPDGKRIVAGGSGFLSQASMTQEGGIQLAIGLVVGFNQATLAVWDATSGEQLLTPKGDTGGVWSVAFSPDGKRIVSGNTDRTLKVWDAVTGQELLALRGHTDEVRSVAFSLDGKRLVSGSADKTLRVWDASRGPDVVEAIGGRVSRPPGANGRK